MTCHQPIALIRPKQREIGAEDLEAALACNPIRDELLGNWRELIADPAQQRLDRIVVYASVEMDGFGYGELAERLAEAGVAVDPELLERSLRRLRFAFALELRQGRQFGILCGQLPVEAQDADVCPFPFAQLAEHVCLFSRRLHGAGRVLDERFAASLLFQFEGLADRPEVIAIFFAVGFAAAVQNLDFNWRSLRM